MGDLVAGRPDVRKGGAGPLEVLASGHHCPATCCEATLNRQPDPKDLRGAAAVARTLAYAAGLAGVVAGGVLYQQGEAPFAVAIWVLTFAVGALLMIAGFLLQAMTAILARLAGLEQDVRVLVGRRGPDPRDGDDHWR